MFYHDPILLLIQSETTITSMECFKGQFKFFFFWLVCSYFYRDNRKHSDRAYTIHGTQHLWVLWRPLATMFEADQKTREEKNGYSSKTKFIRVRYYNQFIISFITRKTNLCSLTSFVRRVPCTNIRCILK